MAVVAVLLINIEKNAVTNIMPSSTISERVPKGLKSTRAKFLSRLHFAEPIAKTNPPKNSIIIGSANDAINALYFTTFPKFATSSVAGRINQIELSETVKSKIVITSTDVVQIGMTSVIHIRAAKKKIAITRCSTIVSP